MSRGVYEQMSTRDLLEMRRAFELDLSGEGDPAFCRGRLALIQKILDARTDPAMPERLRPLELYAWVGLDEAGSGIVGIKQGLVPAGYIPLVATTEEEVNRDILKVAMSIQARDYGQKIYLCRFRIADIVYATEEGAPLV